MYLVEIFNRGRWEQVDAAPTEGRAHKRAHECADVFECPARVRYHSSCPEGRLSIPAGTLLALASLSGLTMGGAL